MPALRVMGFDGEYPRTSPTLLGTNQAQVASNVKLYSQEMRTWRGQSLAYSPPGGVPADIQTIYRLYNGTSSLWLTWPYIVDAVPGPIADLTDIRLYYTGVGIEPRKTNWALADGSTPYPSAYYEMGVPAPTGAPTVSASASGSPVETRAYIYTYNNQFGSVIEESAPSPASALVSLNSGATVTVSGFTAPPSGNYNWVSRNIYRSVAGATTNTYQFVATVPLATTSYVDSLLVAALGGVITTLTPSAWLPPPSTMQGLVSLGNGCLAGFVNNTVWISVPYYPHAWPIANNIALPYSIVGLSVMSGQIVVMTTKYPYVLSGTPGAMNVQQLPLAEPCIAKTTIVSNELGVLYASPNGLVSIGAGGAAIISRALFRRDEWQAINPASMQGIPYDGKYFGVFLSPNAAQPAMVLDPSDVPALSFLTLNAQCVFSDTLTGNFYIVSTVDNNIYQIDANSLQPLQFTWTSKRFVNPQAVAMSAIKVDADYTEITSNAAYLAAVAAVEAANAAAFAAGSLGRVNDTPVNALQVNGSTQVPLPSLASVLNLQVFVYGDNTLICGLTFTSLDPVRLPPFKAREIYFTVVGTISVRSVEMATSVRDLDPKAWSDAAQIPSLYT